MPSDTGSPSRLDTHARAAWADGRHPDHLSVSGIIDDLARNVIAWSILVPAMVGEIGRLQELGFPIAVIPAFRP